MSADRDSDTLTLPEVAKRLGRSPVTIWRIVKRGDDIVPGVRSFKVGSENMVSRIQLDEFLRTGQVSPVVEAEAPA